MSFDEILSDTLMGEKLFVRQESDYLWSSRPIICLSLEEAKKLPFIARNALIFEYNDGRGKPYRSHFSNNGKDWEIRYD